ncbi:hypothetical protein M413DRAFT_236012 [Hebeloma cylindrosporum]|uniref:Uncharacterized protein n=1 Tax=Hebeloma cylindrosporum TaxID=76867 RepID=A0A0C3BR47_HEBCY|nr:hypothetical protein M413DRAFT_236012 [Hebeloma cylindrosporum h7]
MLDDPLLSLDPHSLNKFQTTGGSTYKPKWRRGVLQFSFYHDDRSVNPLCLAAKLRTIVLLRVADNMHQAVPLEDPVTTAATASLIKHKRPPGMLRHRRKEGFRLEESHSLLECTTIHDEYNLHNDLISHAHILFEEARVQTYEGH